jgi:hypothetical protein
LLIGKKYQTYPQVSMIIDEMVFMAFEIISLLQRHLLRQKVCQKISVIKTNTFDDIKKIVHFGILIHVMS